MLESNLWIGSTNVRMYFVIIHHSHPGSLKVRWPLSIQVCIDLLQEVPRCVDFIGDSTIASSGVHIIPEWGHKVPSKVRKWLIEKRAIGTAKRQESICANLYREVESHNSEMHIRYIHILLLGIT